MTSTTRSVIFTAFAALALVGCDQRREPGSAAAPPSAASSGVAPGSRSTTPILPSATATTATPAPPATSSSLPMTNAPHVDRGRVLPLAIAVRGPARFERSADGTRRVRIDVHVLNHFDRPAICERTLFHAHDGATQLVADAGAGTFDEVMPLGPSQEFGGTIAFVVPEGSPTPRHVTLSYGMADEQVLESVSIE